MFCLNMCNMFAAAAAAVTLHSPARTSKACHALHCLFHISFPWAGSLCLQLATYSNLLGFHVLDSLIHPRHVIRLFALLQCITSLVLQHQLLLEPYTSQVGVPVTLTHQHQPLIRPSVHSSIHPFIHSIIHLFIHSFDCLFVCSVLTHAFTHLLIHSSIQPFIQSFCSFVCSCLMLNQ